MGYKLVYLYFISNFLYINFRRDNIFHNLFFLIDINDDINLISVKKKISDLEFTTLIK